MKINKFVFLYFLLFIGCATTVSEKNITNDIVSNFVKNNEKNILTIRFLNIFSACEKIEKRASVPPLTERVGGLAVAGGEVRRGTPSGTGDLTLPSRTTPAPRWGTAN